MSEMIQNNSLNEVVFNIAMAEKHSEDWHKNIQEWQKLYDLEHYKIAPLAGETQFSDPTLTNTVDLAVAILLANPITWKATPWKSTQNALALADQVEKFLIGVFETNTTRNEYDISYEVITNFVRDGGAIIYTYWDDMIAAESKQIMPMMDVNGNLKDNAVVYEECPLRIQVIDPLAMSFLPGGKDRWMAAVRSEKVTLFDIRSRFGIVPERFAHLANDVNSLISTEVALKDYWDIALVNDGENSKMVVRNAVLVDDVYIPGYELKVMENYKSLPYTIGLYKPTDRRNSKKWSGIMTPLIGSVRQLETSINRRQRQIDIFSSMPFVSKTANGRKVSVDPGLGKIVALSTGEDFGFPTWPGNPPDVERQIDFLRSRVQQSGFSDVFFGSGANAVSGYALSQLGDQNRIRFEQPVTHLKRMYMLLAKKISEIVIANAGLESYIRMFGVVKGEPFAGAICTGYLDGQYIRCEIIPEFPNEKVRNHAMATQVRGLLSDRRIMEEYLRVQQPDDEFDIRMNEMAQNHPVVVNYTLMKTLSSMAEAGDEIAKLTLMAMQQGGLAGVPGRPKEASNPEQGLGMPNRAEPMGGEPEQTSDQLASAAPNMEGGVYGQDF